MSPMPSLMLDSSDLSSPFLREYLTCMAQVPCGQVGHSLGEGKLGALTAGGGMGQPADLSIKADWSDRSDILSGKGSSGWTGTCV